MTDRELLEMAAKAAGLTKYSEWADQIRDHDSPHYMQCALHSKGVGGQADSWNPPIDDGDAQRLAVATGVSVHTARPGSKDTTVAVEWVSPVKGGDGVWVDEPIGADRNHDTRRAIVRAAAEIGREME